MPRPTRSANTQTPEDRTLWRKIRRYLSAARRRKRKLYGLSTNGAADLYIPRYFHPNVQRRPRSHSDKIIPFPPNTHDNTDQR